MAVGIIKQFKGPYSSNDTITLEGNSCKIGISIAEDDFMSWGAVYNSSLWTGKDFKLKINNELIHMGRTYMYLSQLAIYQPIVISFPLGAPTSLIIDVVYSLDYKEE